MKTVDIFRAILFCLFLGGPAAADEPLRVKAGCLYPLTGPGALYGRDSAVAIKLAQQHLKTLEAFGYPQVEVLIEDTRSKSLRSLQIARRLVDEDRVDFLCGVVNSSVARAVSEFARDAGVFFIGTDHASPTLTSEDLHPFYFRVSNDTRQSMRAGAKFIQETYGGRKDPIRIAFIGPDYEYGYQAWDDLRTFLSQQNLDFEITGEYWPKVFETDFTPYIQQLMATPTDIVVNGQWGLDFVTFVKQAKQLDLFDRVQFMNFDAGGNYEVLAELENDMPLGLVLSARHHINWPPTDRNRSFVEAFREEAGRYPSYAAEGAYAGVLAIAEAVRLAGGADDRNKLREKLETLTLSLPEDPEGFRSKMDPDSHQVLQVQAIGKTVYDNSYAPAKVMLGDWRIYYPPETWPVLDDGR
ncbi:ABC transporter substrate-binding protein [Stappia sp. BW2]|uniref:ABC transporter substrate-binding protein n=1 Tax=Stappia sp. BW2 TaxID=2592622 RepID=UPI0011DE7550|nr:ABC transporter substrate-binding protein [Stappia sp. BW2]TYC78536.1 ABC transporter substrate-binding protein [Stappia sp. BW2]